MITLADVMRNPDIACYIGLANESMEAMGYTDHGFRHVEIVAQNAREILQKLHYPPRVGELAAIAAYLHDIGNVVSRYNHSQSGALLAFCLLRQMNMDCGEIAQIVAAIGNHDEGEGEIVNDITAALVLADKTDVHRSRVRIKDYAKFDIHDRVNYAVEESKLAIDQAARCITLDLTIDTTIVPVMEYFEIFMIRMKMCCRAANYLQCRFSIMINNAKLL